MRSTALGFVIAIVASLATPALGAASRAADTHSFVIFGERQPGPAAGAEIVEKAVAMAGWLGAEVVICLAEEPERDAMAALDVEWHAPPIAGEVTAFNHASARFVLLGAGVGAERVRSALHGGDATRVYVFTLEPRWRQPDGGWGPIEQALREDGRPISVFSSADRYARDDGADGPVRRRDVGPTGAFTNLEYEAASFQHVTQVKVRDGIETVALIPIEEAPHPESFVGAEFDALDRFRASDWATLDGAVRIGPEQGALSELSIELAGEADMAIDYSAAIDAPPGWTLSQSAFRGRLEPGQRLRLPVHAIAPAIGRDSPGVLLTVRARYPLSFGGEQVVTRRLAAPVEVVGLERVASAGEEGVLVLNGRSAARLDGLDLSGAFTFECWARGRDPQPGRVMCLAGQGAGGMGLYWSDGGEGDAPLPVGLVRTGGGVAETRAAGAWAWGEWTHLALCFDGRESRFYVNGVLQSRATASGMPTPAPGPLYIGADADEDGEPAERFIGWIDDVRISEGARYDSGFSPPRTHEADARTRALLRFDTRVEGLFPDASGSGAHAWAAGGAAIQAGGR